MHLKKCFDQNFNKNIIYIGVKIKNLNFSSHILIYFDTEKNRTYEKMIFST